MLFADNGGRGWLLKSFAARFFLKKTQQKSYLNWFPQHWLQTEERQLYWSQALEALAN